MRYATAASVEPSYDAILFMCISEDAPISLAMSLRLGEVSGDFCQG